MADLHFFYICKYAENWPGPSTNTSMVTRKQAAIQKLITISQDDRKDGLKNFLNGLSVIRVHGTCYKRYTRQDYVAPGTKRRKSAEEASSKQLRLNVEDENETSSSLVSLPDESDGQNNGGFEWTKRCMICGDKTNNVSKDKLRKATTEQVKETILHDLMAAPNSLIGEICRESAIQRLQNACNFANLGGIYHINCYTQIHSYSKSYDKVEITNRINKCMEQIVDYITNHENAHFTIQELLDIFPADSYKPAPRTVLGRLEEIYGDDLIKVGRQKKSTLICISSKGLYDSLNDSYTKRMPSSENDSDFAIIRKAADIIVKEVRSLKFDLTTYPPSDKMLDDLYEKIPENLKCFLKRLILNTPGKKKKAENYQKKIGSAAHVMMSAISPRHYQSPLLLSLAVALHREFGTKNAITIFNACGLTESYSEVLAYERSAAKQEKTAVRPGTFIQFVWDNCDSNMKTILGGEFHCAGEIAIITPASGAPPKEPIPRLTNLTAKDMEDLGKIEIRKYGLPPSIGLKNIKVQATNPQLNLKFTYATKITVFWTLCKYLRPNTTKGWNGFIEDLTAEEEFDTSVIHFLPFIHSKPNDYNTLYTAVCLSVVQARKGGMKTCILTFDQQLWWKVRDIVSTQLIADNITIFVRLGGFHTILSFLGCIGTVMRNSGLEEALSTIYGDTIVKKVMQGKQYSRAIRCHTLTFQAILMIIFNMCKLMNQSFQSTVANMLSKFFENPETRRDFSDRMIL